MAAIKWYWCWSIKLGRKIVLCVVVCPTKLAVGNPIRTNACAIDLSLVMWLLGKKIKSMNMCMLITKCCL